MKEIVIAIFGFLAILVVMLGLAWVVTGNDFFLYQYFAPKKAEVERKVFENTTSYNQGMIQELQNMQFEYIKADKDGKAAMKSIILHRAAAYGEDKLPLDLHSFIQGLKAENTYKFGEKQ